MVDMPLNPTRPNPIDIIYTYNEDLALNNLQWLLCHKTKPNQIKPGFKTKEKKESKSITMIHYKLFLNCVVRDEF